MGDTNTIDPLEYSNEWIKFALADLDAAEILSKNYPIHEEIICFHCQQSAEKSLKAVLALNTVEPPKTHNLSELLLLCKPFIADISVLIQQCTMLNKYSVMPRYPNEIAVSENDAKIAIRFAQDVINIIKPLIY
jgi:HEPN domain-containing protein